MLKDTPSVWEHSTVAERIQHCISMLYIHGYIPKSARDKAHQKLQKDWNKESNNAQ